MLRFAAVFTFAIVFSACSGVPPRGPAAAVNAAPAPTFTAVPNPPEPNWAYAQHQLELAKFSAPFIKDLKKNYDPKGFEDVIRLNVLLFLKKSDVHGPQITDQAVTEASQFLKTNKTTLNAAETRYGVSGRIIASLLWLESRYGKNSGHFHVPSVFVHLVQATRPEVLAYLLTQTDRYTDSLTPEQKNEIGLRTHKKAEFALQELHALERAFKWRWKLDSDFRGSYSGAFGMPQFLPSSYVQYSRSILPKNQPALDQPNDAILSVAFYLRQHGWRPRSAPSHIKALMGYNNSLDYANAIVALSEKI